MLSRWGGRPGIGGGFDSSHCPVVGTFDRFNGFCSNILLTFSYYFDNPQMPWGGHLNRNSQLRSNAPPMPGLPLPPISLTLIGALPEAHPCLERHPLSTGYTLLRLGDWCTVFSQDLSVADPYALRQQNELFQGFDDHLSYPPSWMSFPDPALFAWSCLAVFSRSLFCILKFLLIQVY